MMIVMELLQNGKFRRNDEPIELIDEAIAILRALKDFQTQFLMNQTQGQQFLSNYPFISSGFDFMISMFFPHLTKESQEAKTKALVDMFVGNVETILDSDTVPSIKEVFVKLDSVIRKDWKGMMEAALEYITKESPLGLLHGDFKLDNFFLCDDGKVIIIDWQSVSLGNPLFDAANFVTQSLSRELSINSYESIIIPIYSNLFEATVLRKCFETALWMQLLSVSLFANSPMFKNASANQNSKKEIGALYDLIMRGAEFTPLLLCKLLS